MLYHFTSRPHWERIVEDGEIKALSPPDLAFEPKVVHLTLSASERALPASVVPETVICIDDDSSLNTMSFLEWWSLELPPGLQPLFEQDLGTATGWPVRPEVHWYVVKGPVPAALWVEAKSLVDDARLWPPPAG
jgi:hypothetical protein